MSSGSSGEKWDYLGCFEDTDPNEGINRGERMLEKRYEFKTNNTPENCAAKCSDENFQYFAVQYGYECWCGYKVNHKNQKPEQECKEQTCPGSSVGNQEFCGGGYRNRLYHLKNTSPRGKFMNCVVMYIYSSLLFEES